MLKHVRGLGGKALLGVAATSTLLLGACSAPSTSTSTGTTPAAQTLTSCHATVADITEGGSGQATAPAGTDTGTHIIDGSSALQPLFIPAAAEFDHANQTHTTVNAGGSGKGLTDVNNKAVVIGMSDLFQADKNISGLTDHQVAVVAFTLVVSPDIANTVQNLTSSQIQQIYSGQVTSWSQLGGPSEAITVVTRPTTSGTRGTFDKYVLQGTAETPTANVTQDNTGAVFSAVSGGKGAIGYVSTGFVTSASTAAAAPSPICIDGYKANKTDINSGNYKFWNIEHAYTNGAATGFAKDFLTYVESDAFQSADVPALNFYRMKDIAATAIATHQEAGAPTPESFYP
jgi:phosphate transport system substrate-binding protein